MQTADRATNRRSGLCAVVVTIGSNNIGHVPYNFLQHAIYSKESAHNIKDQDYITKIFVSIL